MQFIDEEIFLLAPTDYRVMPWKNGGGTTREILAHPSDTENFDWRLSIADIRADGPFSPFPGYARTIMLLNGDGMRLQIDNAPAVTVHEKFRPVDFDGGSETYCTLAGGPIRDFNIMSAKARATHTCNVIEHFPFAPPPMQDAAAFVIFALRGSLRARVTRATNVKIPESHCLLITSPTRLRQLNAVTGASALTVSITNRG